jgi:hypothetical protein
MYLHVHMNNHSTRYEMTGTKSKSSLRLVEFLKSTFPQQPDQELDTMFVGFFIVSLYCMNERKLCLRLLIRCLQIIVCTI